MPITIACTKCEKTLMVPDAAIGKKVRCPACQEIVAVPAAAPKPAEDAVTAAPAPPAPAPSKPAAWDKDDKDAIEEDAPPKKSKKKGEDAFAFSDDDDETRDRPRKRRRDEDYDDDEDDDFDMPRVRRAAPHRAGTVLTLGIVSILASCICPIAGWVTGGIAINMAKTDLAQMDKGKMDEAGRSNTQVGRICGIIGVVIGVINFIAGIAIQLGNLPRH